MVAELLSGSTTFCDGVSIEAILREEGTPVYVYDASVVRDRYRDLDIAFGDYPHRIHYALKANSTIAIARLIRSLGGRVDANSGGEIAVATKAGFDPDDIVFTGVGKSQVELELAVRLGVFAINVESRGELERIDRIARSHGVKARVAVRINPGVESGTHPQISTGQLSHKFGIPIDQAGEVCRWVVLQKGLNLVGLHVHIGSQLIDLGPIKNASEAVVAFSRDLASLGVDLEYIDVGGGLGISYDGTAVPSAAAYGETVVSAIKETGLPIITEPGRWIIGPAGVLISAVVDVKPQANGRYFVVVDAGMSELIRPALYGSFHRIELLKPNDTALVTCDVVGPICETSDVFGRKIMMPLPCVGDLLAICDTGAYGSTMASNYNRHPLPAEVLVDNSTWSVIRRRQTTEEMLAQES
tara:strand:+ start:4047 stop:5288 length:1242 start_codon:yes stop_codon:yes gene_type:complete